MKKFVRVTVRVTASNEAKIKRAKEKDVMKLADKYDFLTEWGPYPLLGGLVCQIKNGRIRIFGYDWPNLSSEPNNDESNWECIDNFEEFLKEIAPFLAEDLIIHSVGDEGCIFPLIAREIKVTPRGKVVRGGGFKWA
jgi:hypothetical protein